MLGFSPLASSALADTGTEQLMLTSITTGVPTVGTSSITQVHALTASNITTGLPVVGTSSITQAHTITASNITTGLPVVGQSNLNGSIRRVVSVTSNSGNTATFNTGNNTTTFNNNQNKAA